ncbi:MAG: glycoside hydrolase family 88 protein [Firmicutes bacterium]|nr:glycoside hydrolase family 88 protein [Bacillota bacterium]
MTLITMAQAMVRRTLQMNFSWDWPAAVAFYGVCCSLPLLPQDDAEQATGYLDVWLQKRLTRGIPRLTINTCAMGHVLLSLAQIKKSSDYLAVARELGQYLLREAPKFGEGVLEHTVAQDYQFHGQAWVDTLFMGAYFLLRLSRETQEAEFFDEAMRQYQWHEALLQDARTNLFYHGWNDTEKNHLSSVFWGRGNAWAALTFAAALREFSPMYPQYMDLRDAVRDQLDSLALWQTDEGFWRTIVDDPEAYEESSATAGIAAAMLIFDDVEKSDAYHEYALKAWAGLQGRIVEGVLTGVSSGTAVMPHREDYKKIPHKRIQGWGQGLGLVFLSELFRTFQEEDPE